MTDVNAAFAKVAANALRNVAPMYADAIDICADAKIENARLRENCDRMASLAIDNARDTERLREALQKIAEFDYEDNSGLDEAVIIARSALQQKDTE